MVPVRKWARLDEFLGNLLNIMNIENIGDNDNSGSSNGWVNTWQRLLATVPPVIMCLIFKLK